MKKRSYILITATVIFLLILCIGTIIKPDTEFSFNENRYLQQKPDLTIVNVLNGKFESQWEEYLSDQIIGREKWVEAKSFTEAAVGISDINGVYMCTGGRVVEKITESDFDWDRYEKNLAEAEKLGGSCWQEDVDFKIVLVPTAAYVYEDTLPDSALKFNEDMAFELAKKSFGDDLIDIRDTLLSERTNGEVFFKTDHHWTGRGAYAAYRDFASAIGKDMTGANYENLDTKVLADDFKGTLYSKVLLKTLGTDIIETSASALEADYQVTIEGKDYDSLFFNEFLEKKDKYAVYFGGNYDRVDIKTAGEGSGGKILIIKDSFANSFIPFILGDFSEITMVDTRFYRDNIGELAKEYDHVLILYSVNNFATERIILTESLLK